MVAPVTRGPVLNGPLFPLPTNPCNFVVPDTFSDDVHVVLLFNIVVPDMYNDIFIDVLAAFGRIAS